MIFFKRRIFKIFMIGLIVRICLMLFFAHPFDMYSWYSYCVDYLNHGFNVDILKTPYPLWPIVLSLLAELYVYMLKFIPASPVLINTLPDIFNPYYKITVIPGPLFNFIIKFPMLITDILSSVFIYRIIKTFILNLRGCKHFYTKIKFQEGMNELDDIIKYLKKIKTSFKN